jgi:hypothetical protein
MKQNQQVIETRDRRSAKDMVVAISCEITKIDNEKETYKVQSETDVSKYYICKFMDGTPVFCECADFLYRIKSNPNHICKHQKSIVVAENYGLIKSVVQQSNNKSYLEDEYSF